MIERIVVFAGPTCHSGIAAERLGELDGEVTVLPPAAQGDVARLVALPSRRRPRVIALIDGVYERVPAVWHKEILWALSQGIKVAGAASMGALRAAELAPYGMTGIGEVFQAARDGLLTDDDEVAVAHLDAGKRHRPVSDALVDIRATLRAAVAEDVIEPVAQEAIAAYAKRLHYPERSWPALLRLPEAAPLRPWLARGRISVKARDAVALLDALPTLPEPGNVRVEETEQWRAARPPRGTGALGPELRRALLDGLRRDGSYEDLERAAVLRLVAARLHGTDRLGTASLEEWVQRIRDRVGPADLDGLDPAELAELAADQAALVEACSLPAADLDAAIIDTLRIRGEYAQRIRALTNEPPAGTHEPPARARETPAREQEKEDP